jgi:hypothetical protein
MKVEQHWQQRIVVVVPPLMMILLLMNGVEWNNYHHYHRHSSAHKSITVTNFNDGRTTKNQRNQTNTKRAKQ